MSSGVPSVSVNPPDLPNALVVSNNIVNSAGQAPSTSYLQHACSGLPGMSGTPAAVSGGLGQVAPPPGGQHAFQQCVDTISEHFHEVVVYQPANRFWAFQTYETLLFVAMSAALAGLCVWWVRRRLS